MSTESAILTVFAHCIRAIHSGKLIHRTSRQDKEFHFQDWFRTRLEESGLHYKRKSTELWKPWLITSTNRGHNLRAPTTAIYIR
jgi:hypothetical protein